MTYLVAERFKSIQGEGAYTGTPMAFVRFVGCSVGKKICASCDTDFDKVYPWREGGEYTGGDLLKWAWPYRHICLTGGEPLNQDIRPFFSAGFRIHVETSGTVWPDEETVACFNTNSSNLSWLCVSPKPGYLTRMIELANEIKVIVPGLGPGDGWPSLGDAVRWARSGKRVYLQPRNLRYDVDKTNLMFVQDIVREHPELRLSVQMHKILKVQ
jgi:organic radical activating enzyme